MLWGWDTVFAAGGLLVGVYGAFAAWTSARRSELRREEVLAWVNEAIACLETVVLLTRTDWYLLLEPVRNERMQEESFKASILAEQGRMFFRNEASEVIRTKVDVELKKEPAYRGYRPLILDELIIVHGLCREWPSLNESERLAANKVAI